MSIGYRVSGIGYREGLLCLFFVLFSRLPCVNAQHLRIFACAIGNDSADAFMGGSTNGSGLYQSDDTGKTWKHLGWNNIKCYSMDMVQSSNGRILYEATGLGVLRSTDYGEHWKQITDWRISEVMDIAIDQKNPNEIYLATAHGAWRTENEGRDWIKIHSVRDPSVEKFNYHIFLYSWQSLRDKDTEESRLRISPFVKINYGFPSLDTVWCDAYDPNTVGGQLETMEPRSYITGGPRGIEEGYKYKIADSTYFEVDTTVRNVASLLFAGDNLLIGSLDSGLLSTQIIGESWISGKKEMVLPRRQIWALKSFEVSP